MSRAAMLGSLLLLSGCAVITVADAGISVVATTVELAADITSATVRAVVPGI